MSPENFRQNILFPFFVSMFVIYNDIIAICKTLTVAASPAGVLRLIQPGPPSVLTHLQQKNTTQV